MFRQKAKLKKGKLDLFRFWRRFNPPQNSRGKEKRKVITLLYWFSQIVKNIGG
jgi:hypothetical protein